jgi:hypothetical protein
LHLNFNQQEIHMPVHRPFWGLMAFAIFASAAIAQQPGSAEQRMEQFERRLSELERKYQADLKARDDEIAQLKAQLQRAQPAATAPAARSTQDLIKEIDAGPATTAAAAPRTQATFNPDVTVVADFVGNLSTRSSNKARNRSDIRAVELDLRAPVHPRADAVLILPFVRELEDPLFFESGMDQEGPENAVEIEEAYLFLHNFGISNLTAKLGRFHLRFGRQNLLHAHDWPTVDNNFVNQSFLGGEALSDAGLSLSYVIPPGLIGDQYVELIAEIISGEGGESPTLNNDASVQSPALNLHALWNRDIRKNWNLELGTSFLAGKHDNQASMSTSLFGLDATLIRTDPSGRFNNQLFQAEAIYGITDTSETDSQHAWGAYALAQQQLNKDWYAGLRVDWTENALDDSQEVWGISPYVSWYWSEFLRFRIEYQHRTGDTPSENTVFFQATWLFGAHPPHPYWSMR